MFYVVLLNGMEDLTESVDGIDSEKFRGFGAVPINLLVEGAQAVFSMTLAIFTIINLFTV